MYTLLYLLVFTLLNQRETFSLQWDVKSPQNEKLLKVTSGFNILLPFDFGLNSDERVTELVWGFKPLYQSKYKDLAVKKTDFILAQGYANRLENNGNGTITLKNPRTSDNGMYKLDVHITDDKRFEKVYTKWISLAVKECARGHFGRDCENTCSDGCNLKRCDTVTGECTRGCRKGWTSSTANETCESKCPKGKHGVECEENCPPNCGVDSCHHITGQCLNSCKAGWNKGPNDKCDQMRTGACLAGHYVAIDDSSRNVHNTDDDTPLCDHNFMNQTATWYRFFDKGRNAVIPTTCPAIHHCLTHAPIWIENGQNMKKLSINKELRVKACVHWDDHCCRWSHYIDVRFCGDYYVYRIDPISNCYTRYCTEIQ